MKVNTPLLIGASLMLIAAVLPLTNVSAHDCHTLLFTPPTDPNDPNTGCNGASCPDQGSPHSHENDLPPAKCKHPTTPCKLQHTSPHSHTYGFGGSAGARSDTVTGGDEVGAGVVTVFETNAADCDGDGVPGDYDGDWETGVGGGFFGYGPWANEPICNYGLAAHGASVVVNDVVFGKEIAFVIGADDTSGPVISTDPVTGETTCETDGSITPGDPTTDPTADADDCLTEVFIGQGTTCGAGGDGGYWVFLNGALVSEGAGGTGASNAPTAGTITA